MVDKRDADDADDTEERRCLLQRSARIGVNLRYLRPNFLQKYFRLFARRAVLGQHRREGCIECQCSRRAFLDAGAAFETTLGIAPDFVALQPDGTYGTYFGAGLAECT